MNLQKNLTDAAGNRHLEKGITGEGEVFCDPAEKVHADGAYHSPPNQEFVAKKNAGLILHAIQGPKGRYGLEMDENGILTVKDLKTDIPVAALKMKDGKKCRIRTGGYYRYFSDKEISACLLGKKIAEIPQDVLNIRNNVEATIFQLGYHRTNDKTRYRGTTKHSMWANIRCLWANFVRIMKYMLKNGAETVFSPKTGILLPTGSNNGRAIVKIEKLKTGFINESFQFPKTQIFANS